MLTVPVCCACLLFFGGGDSLTLSITAETERAEQRERESRAGELIAGGNEKERFKETAAAQRAGERSDSSRVCEDDFYLMCLHVCFHVFVKLLISIHLYLLIFCSTRTTHRY